jgi:Flp pilus assembly protein TadB
MPKTKAKRRRKHRGTQAGTVERRAEGRASGSAAAKTETKAERREAARARRLERLDRPPTWRSAFNRAAIAAVIVGVLAVLALGNTPPQAVILAGTMLLVYIPLGYAFDNLIYRVRQRRKARVGR